MPVSMDLRSVFPVVISRQEYDDLRKSAEFRRAARGEIYRLDAQVQSLQADLTMAQAERDEANRRAAETEKMRERSRVSVANEAATIREAVKWIIKEVGEPEGE